MQFVYKYSDVFYRIALFYEIEGLYNIFSIVSVQH